MALALPDCIEAFLRRMLITPQPARIFIQHRPGNRAQTRRPTTNHVGTAAPGCPAAQIHRAASIQAPHRGPLSEWTKRGKDAKPTARLQPRRACPERRWGVESLCSILPQVGEKAYTVGRIVKGERKVMYS